MRKQDVNIHIRISEELKEQFEKACAYNGRKISDVLRRYIREYISEKEERK